MVAGTSIRSGFSVANNASRLALTVLASAIYALLLFVMVGKEPAPFVIDEAIYVAMTDALSRRGDLALEAPDILSDGPPVEIFLTTIGADGRVYPQYPVGYAIIAAPFYLAFGVFGFFLLNAISGLAVLYLTARIARRLFGDERIAMLAAIMVGAASFFSTYAFSIMPHMISLALLLGAADLMLSAADEHKGSRRTRWLIAAAAGALIAAAMSIRADSVIFFAPLFIWLRLFGAPKDRVAGAAFIAGAAPVLLMLAYSNFLKFGVFSPITYGQTVGYERLDAYAPIGALLILAGLLIALVDLRPVLRWSGLLVRRAPTALIAIAIVIVCASPPGFAFLHHFWTLMFDIQTYNGDYFHDLLSVDAAGFKTIAGMPKRAFFESMPYLVICLLPLVGFLKGEKVRARAFCLLFAAAPIVFFSMKQWHGGYSYNMRFLLPAIPFLAILAAETLLCIKPGGTIDLRDVRNAIAGAVITLFTQAAILSIAPRYGIAAVTLPQLCIALTLLAVAGFYLLRPSKRLTIAFVGLAFFSCGAAAASAYSSYALTQLVRENVGEGTAYFARTLPAGSLVFSINEMQLYAAMLDGVSVMRPNVRTGAELTAAIDAFSANDRCVYAMQEDVVDFVRARTGRPFTPALTGVQDAFKLWTPAPAKPGCLLP